MDEGIAVEELTPGLYPDMTSEAYHTGIGKQALGNTGIQKLIVSPAKLESFRADPPPPTPAMELGAAFHCALFEWEIFHKTYVVEPKFDRRTKVGKEKSAEWELEKVERNLKVISEQNLELINLMVDSVYANDVAAGLLDEEDGESEQSIFWLDPVYGFLCKCRPDFRNKTHRIIIDVKSTVDASIGAFRNEIARRGYHIQAKWYLDGVNNHFKDDEEDGDYTRFIWIAVEKTGPFDGRNVEMHRADRRMLERAEEKIATARVEYAECMESGYWFGRGNRINTISLPRYAYYD